VGDGGAAFKSRRHSSAGSWYSGIRVRGNRNTIQTGVGARTCFGMEEEGGVRENMASPRRVLQLHPARRRTGDRAGMAQGLCVVP
jgi:hypothetical protein